MGKIPDTLLDAWVQILEKFPGSGRNAEIKQKKLQAMAELAETHKKNDRSFLERLFDELKGRK